MSDEENIVDPSHPRYESLMIRKKVADAEWAATIVERSK